MSNTHDRVTFLDIEASKRIMDITKLQKHLSEIKQRIEKMKPTEKRPTLSTHQQSKKPFNGLSSSFLHKLGCLLVDTNTKGTVVGKTPSAIIDDNISSEFPMDGNHKPSVKIDPAVIYYKGNGTRNKIPQTILNGKHQKTYLDVFSSNKRMILTKSIGNLSTEDNKWHINAFVGGNIQSI